MHMYLYHQFLAFYMYLSLSLSLSLSFPSLYLSTSLPFFVRVIRDWATDGNRGIGPMTTASMADVSFLDLNIRLGQPYVYFHQGDCEHLIVFSDLR